MWIVYCLCRRRGPKGHLTYTIYSFLYTFVSSWSYWWWPLVHLVWMESNLAVDSTSVDCQIKNPLILKFPLKRSIATSHAHQIFDSAKFYLTSNFNSSHIFWLSAILQNINCLSFCLCMYLCVTIAAGEHTSDACMYVIRRSSSSDTATLNPFLTQQQQQLEDMSEDNLPNMDNIK